MRLRYWKQPTEGNRKYFMHLNRTKKLCSSMFPCVFYLNFATVRRKRRCSNTLAVAIDTVRVSRFVKSKRMFQSIAVSYALVANVLPHSPIHLCFFSSVPVSFTIWSDENAVNPSLGKSWCANWKKLLWHFACNRIFVSFRLRPCAK